MNDVSELDALQLTSQEDIEQNVITTDEQHNEVNTNHCPD